MNSETASRVIDASVGVVWSDDVDPLARTPLWASVQFIALNSSVPHLHQSTAGGSIVIEVSATPRTPCRAHPSEHEVSRLGPRDTGRVLDAWGDSDRGGAVG
jgi:hypothetical protein